MKCERPAVTPTAGFSVSVSVFACAMRHAVSVRLRLQRPASPQGAA